MNKPFTKEAYNYSLYGALFGLCFPIIATLIESAEHYNSFAFSDLWNSQLNSPLLWIINTAPFFLGLFAFFIGQQLDKVKSQKAEILRTQEQLILQEQMASIGKMMAGIAHEIKNPLNFVINFAESSIEITEEMEETLSNLRKCLPTEDYGYLIELVTDLLHNAKDIHSNGARASRIVLSLMDHTRVSKGEHQKIDLNSMMDENVKLAYHSFRANHPEFNMDIKKDYEKEKTYAMANPNSLGRVILNLINNACYAMRRKMVEQGLYDPVLEVSIKQLEKELELVIKDNGPGIPESIRQSIFQPFYTTKPVGEGNAGLGLAISRDIIVAEHMGSIDIQSQEGAFTTFIIRLPLKGEDEDELTKSQLYVSKNPSR
ncbi:MAG: ATP-binding protein [Bacteroidota bacterium]